MKFRKPTFIIGKKQIILSCLTLLLGIAVYINYVLAQSNELNPDKLSKTGVSVYGEAEFVSAADDDESLPASVDTEPTGEEYFAQARLDKLTSRDEAVETLQTILGGGDLTEDELVTQALEAVSLSQLIESETTVETLVKAQGFEDCIVYLDGKTAKVIVKTEGLDAAGAAAIKDIILGEVEVLPENIRIFEINS